MAATMKLWATLFFAHFVLVSANIHGLPPRPLALSPNMSLPMGSKLELRQAQESADLDNQSWIQNWAALGDSYAAGIGSGSRTNFPCSRYNLSYPALMSIDDRMGSNPNRKFTFWACSGHTIDYITNVKALDPRHSGQVWWLTAESQDVV